MENLQDKIQDYIKGRLEGAELNAFENALKTDAELAEQVRFYKNIEAVMNNQDIFDLRQTVRDVITNTPITPDFSLKDTNFDDAEPKTQNPKLSWKWGLSLVGILMVMAALFWFANAPKRQAQTVAQQFAFEPYDNIFNVDSLDKRPLAQAVRAYIQGNYAAAIPLFDSHLKTYTDDTDAQFYYGLCLALVNDYEKAIIPLQNVVNYNARLAMDARWYLALCHLKNGDLDLAKPLLIAIPQESLFGEKAKQVLEKLK